MVLTGNLVSSVFQKLTLPKTEVDVLYYNRMTKCAGEYMLELMKRLKNRNRFILLNEIKQGQKHYFLGDEAEERWAANIKRQVDTQFEQDWHTKLILSRHQYFLDLKGFFWEGQYKNHTFALINLVRHPIDQFLSNFYFDRRGFKSETPYEERELTDVIVDPNTLNLTYDQCLEQKFVDCVKPYSEFLYYFCGRTKLCHEDKNYALAQAKQNILDHYFIIGYVEQLDKFVHLLELTMPHIFEGLDLENDDLKDDAEFLETLATKKPENSDLSDKARLYLTEKLKHEIDLYDFITNLFYNNFNSFVNPDGSKKVAPQNQKSWKIALF